VVAGFAGLITLGCGTFATYSGQNPNINTSSENISANKGENNSTINTDSQVIFANASEEVSLQQQNMAYREARKLIIQQDWSPNLQGESPNLQDISVKELFDLGYKEIKDCSGTGEGPCRFELINNKGELLVVVATIRRYENTKSSVKTWWVEKNLKYYSTKFIQQDCLWFLLARRHESRFRSPRITINKPFSKPLSLWVRGFKSPTKS
jgi:hypothetical protein